MQLTFDGMEGGGGGAADYERRRERSRTQQAEQSRRGREIGPLPEAAEPEEVEACRLDFRRWCETFFGATFSLEWSEDHLKVIAKIQRVVLEGGEFAMAMPRSSGKTSLVTAATMWSVAYGHRRFVVVVGATSPKAQDLVRNIKEAVTTNERLGAAFPAMCYPIRALEGQNNRAGGQLLNGTLTSIEWTKKRLRFPRVDGAASSQVIVHADGLLAEGIRGLQLQTADGATLRPELLLLDDPQSDKSAKSPAQTAYRMKVLNGSLRGLGGPSKQIAMLCPCTVIQNGDLADQLLDTEKFPEWRGEKLKLLYAMPTNTELWQKYREIREDSLREHGDIRDATEFYRENREAMDAGAEPAWPARYQSHQLSAIQYAMDLWAYDEISFLAEYQNTPAEEDEGDLETLKAADLIERCNLLPRGVAPEWTTHLTAFVDVQQDCLPFVVCAFGEDLTGSVIDYGAYPKQNKRYWTLRDLSPTLRDTTGMGTIEQALAAGLEIFSDELLGTEYRQRISADSDETRPRRIDWLGIDANWQISSELVYQVARRRPTVWPHHGRFVGAASLPMSGWKRDAGTKAGHFWRLSIEGKRGRHFTTDINAWKTIVAKRLKVEPDKPGAITFFGQNPRGHELLADQLSAEYGVRVEGRGRRVDEWKLRPGRDNHFWDCLIGCAVGANYLGGRLPGQQETKQRRRISLAELQKQKRGRA